MKNLMFSLVVMILIGSTAECATWEAMDSPTTVGLTNVWGTAPDDMFAVGYSGTILHYDGNPDNIWEQMPCPTTVSLIGIWGFGPDDVYVTGDQCTMLHYDGNSWTLVPGIPTSGIYILGDIWGSDSNNIFVTAEGYDNKGHIIHWDGSSWSGITLSFPLTAGALFEIWGLAADDVYVSGYNGYSGGTTGLMYHYNGSTWELFHPDGLGDHDLPKTRAIGGIWNNSGSPDKLFLAAQSYGSSQSNWFAEVLYYDGSTWQTKTFSEYPQCHGATEVWGSTLDDVYVTCDAGLILHGNSDFEWSVMDSGTTENLNGIWGNGPGDVFVVGSNGTILRLVGPIEKITDFIDKSVDNGRLIPIKDGKPGQGQLGALINMIEAAGNLIDAELLADACGQLHAALEKTDGLNPPESAPDFVTGPAAPELAAMIEALMENLGCE